MRGVIVAVCMLMLAGCASSRACIGLLERAETRYDDSLSEAKRAVRDKDRDDEQKWKAVLSDFGQVQGIVDESRRRYNSLKREDPDKDAELRSELENVRYFQRLNRVYACSLKMQGIALHNLGSETYSVQKMKAGELAAREAEERYKYTIDCGYGGL